jgi:dsDNA-specific endonuclease/ATPase MutS2
MPPDDDEDDDAPWDPDAVIEVAITDELDLHHFAPREVGGLVAEYLEAAQARGFTVVRIIHGKGTGALRRTVHAALDRHPLVAGHRPGGDREGGWGATVVTLRPPAPA